MDDPARKWFLHKNCLCSEIHVIIIVKRRGCRKIKVPSAKFGNCDVRDVFLDSKTSLPSSPLTTWWIIIFGSLQLLTLGFRQFVTLDKASFLQDSSVKRTNSQKSSNKSKASLWTLWSYYWGKALLLVLHMFWACSRCVYDARSDMWIDRRPSWCTDSKNFNTSECIRIMPSNLFCARADAVLPEFGRLWCRGEVLWYLWAADFPPLSVQDLCSISAVFVQALCSICEVQYLLAADFAGREGQIYN